MRGATLLRHGKRKRLAIHTADAWGNICKDQSDRVNVVATLDGEPVYEKSIELERSGWSFVRIEDLPVDRPGELT